jgi:hypothetical protein
MKILNRKMTAPQFTDYIWNLKIPFWRKINWIILHHTSSPIETWEGTKSMLHYYNLYRSRGWTAGAHIFIAPDGIWLFTPIAKKGKCSSPDADRESIHIEIVGRYFDKAPDNPEIRYFSGIVISNLVEKFNIDLMHIMSHFDFENFSNCSPHTNSDYAEDVVKEFNAVIPKKIVGYTSTS